MTKHVYLVRHGQTDSNVDGMFRGRQSMLTELGVQQARTVAKRVAGIGIDAIVSSPYPRTLDTAAEIAKLTGLTIDSNELFAEWREATATMHKPKTDPEVKEILDLIYGPQEHDYRHSDEETFAELVERGQRALDFLVAHPAERIAVVTHGAFLRILFGCVVFRGDFTRHQFMQLFTNFRSMNTGVSHMRYADERGWQFLTLNDDAHLL